MPVNPKYVSRSEEYDLSRRLMDFLVNKKGRKVFGKEGDSLSISAARD